jgi:predicted DCC family thiol-disulfide oxidoreductase YuxK
LISLHTEITDNNAAQTAGRVFYDGECHLCLAWARRWRGALGRRHFHLLPLQSPDAARRLGMAVPDLPGEMRLLLADGRNLGGADALVEIARRIWWAWPLWAGSRIPGAMPVLRAGYRVLAANRHCANGICLITHRSKPLDWLPLVVLPTAALACRNMMSDWIFMWVLAFTIFFGCKWLTLRRAFAGRPRPHRLVALAYLFLWPGMDANTFFTGRANNRPAFRVWIGATAKTFAGVALLWLSIVGKLSTAPWLTAWLGMMGVVLLLHFGLFHLLALGWQATGRNVKPLMRAPLLATSLTDFWGHRWNTAFNTLVHNLAFRPLVRRIGAGWATLSVFLISGAVHDLVISLPARGGYGLPTAYFVLQGVAVLFERSRTGRALGLGRSLRGWTFMLLVTAAPAFWLFHPTFIHNVILPMLQTIGATWNTP